MTHTPAEVSAFTCRYSHKDTCVLCPYVGGVTGRPAQARGARGSHLSAQPSPRWIESLRLGEPQAPAVVSPGDVQVQPELGPPRRAVSLQVWPWTTSSSPWDCRGAVPPRPVESVSPSPLGVLTCTNVNSKSQTGRGWCRAVTGHIYLQPLHTGWSASCEPGLRRAKEKHSCPPGIHSPYWETCRATGHP